MHSAARFPYHGVTNNSNLFLMTFSDVVITQSVFFYKMILFICICQIKSLLIHFIYLLFIVVFLGYCEKVHIVEMTGMDFIFKFTSIK